MIRGRPSCKAKFRLHTQFDLERGVPIRIDVTEGIGRGEASERAVLGKALEKGRCYVDDRGYAKFKLFNADRRRRKQLRLPPARQQRLRDRRATRALRRGPRSGRAARRGGAVGRDESKADARPDHLIRLVVVKTTPHEKRGGAGPASNGQLLIATNLLDLPAWIIALIYRYRWTIEVFFRFFKHVLGCRHLLSHDPVGIEIQTYCAIIACMLISLWTGRKPTLRTYEMICHYFTGLAEEDELLAHLAKLQKQDAQA